MKPLLLIIFIIFAGFTSLHAHQLAFTFETYEGKPVKYAMVKIAEQGKFYICDANGRIQFEGKQGVNQFTLEVSALNIRDTTMQIERIPGKEHYTVTLQEEEFLLPEFTKDEGREFKRRSRRAGYRGVLFPIGHLSYSETEDSLLGLESATMIENDDIIRLEEISLRIHHIRVDTFYLGFNIRIPDESNLPGEKLFPSNFIVPATEKGWLTLDLTDHNIYLENNYFLTYTLLSEPIFIYPKGESRTHEFLNENMTVSFKIGSESKTWKRRPGAVTWEHFDVNPLIRCSYRELR